jgi:DNA invertase Pin-like site-specific DNA recombinase
VIVGYLRVSSRSQSTDTQRAAIERIAKARGEPIAQWFEETKSAKTIKRPALEALRDSIRQGGVRVLYVYRLDRLSRSGIRDTFGLLEEFRGRGVAIVTVCDGFTLDGPAADVVVAVLAWAAQMERLAIGERISDAHKRIEAKGGKWGRPKSVDAMTIARILAMREAGESIRRICVCLHCTRGTVCRVVSQKPPPNGTPQTASETGGNRGASQ